LTAAKAELPLTHPDDFLNLGAHPIEGNVSDLDFLWNVCHADAFFCRGNGEGGIRWYSCRFFVPTVKVIGW
jgi:hypothetical protein